MSDDVELLALKRRKAKLLAQQAKELRENALAYYKPHVFQEKFHVAGEFRERLVEAGNRSGKSEMGAAEDAAWLLGGRRWYAEGDPRRTLGIPTHPVKGLLVVTNWQKGREIFMDDAPGNEGKIIRYIPKNMIKSMHKKLETIYLIILTNGSSLTLTTVEAFKKNPQSMESSDWDFIHFDEPCPKPMYQAVTRGLIDRGGKAWFTLTPLSEPWISNKFFPDAEAHLESSVYDPKTNRPQLYALSFSSFDNPYITKEALLEYAAGLSDEEKECRLYGKPFSHVGLIFREFSPDKHVLRELPKGWSAWNKPPSTYSHYVFIDPHPRTPHAVQFWAIPPSEGRCYLYDEIFKHCAPSELAREIKLRLGTSNLIEVYMDPAGFIEDPETELSPADRFEAVGLPVMKASKDLDFGILYAKEKLALDGFVRICPHCIQTLSEFRSYRWATDRLTGEPLNKPVDKNDHMMENFRRAMLAEMFYSPPTTSSPVEILEIPSADYTLTDLTFAS